MFRASVLIAAALLVSCAPVARPGTLVISRDDYDRLRAEAALARSAPGQRAVAIEESGNELGYQASPEQHAKAEREKAVIAYAGVMLARRSTRLVASTEL